MKKRPKKLGSYSFIEKKLENLIRSHSTKETNDGRFLTTRYGITKISKRLPRLGLNYVGEITLINHSDETTNELDAGFFGFGKRQIAGLISHEKTVRENKRRHPSWW